MRKHIAQSEDSMNGSGYWNTLHAQDFDSWG